MLIATFCRVLSSDLILYIQKLAHCLALLPKSKGDEESWSVMLQKILILINDQLNLKFEGLEEGRCWCYVSPKKDVGATCFIKSTLKKLVVTILFHALQITFEKSSMDC